MLKADRNPFVIRTFNWLAPHLGIERKLDFDRLINKARKNTGLQELGSDFREEALKHLIQSANEEARLHSFGRLMLREKLISQLENRLWAEHWFRKHPEILEQEVLPILLITGLQRTGTTRMQRLLSRMPGARALLSWEALYPAPLGEAGETRKRLARTRRNEKAIKWIAPTFQAIHPIYHDQPEEDLLLLDLQFTSSSSEAILNIPSFATWLKEQDPVESYEYERKLLLLLQWQRSGNYWVLKSPHHLEYLPAFTRVFPETKIIWMHRELSECIPSFLSMLYHSRAMFSNIVHTEEIKEEWIPKVGRMIEGGMVYRNQKGNSVLDISYRDLVRNESGVLERIGAKISGLDLYPLAAAGPDNGMNYKSRHHYSMGDWGLTREKLRGLFGDYYKLFQQMDQKISQDE